MHIADAFNITAPPSANPLKRAEPQGVRPASCSGFEFDLQGELDKEIGSKPEITAAVASGYGLRLHEAEAALYGARLFLRGKANIYAARLDLSNGIKAMQEALAALPDEIDG